MLVFGSVSKKETELVLVYKFNIYKLLGTVFNFGYVYYKSVNRSSQLYQTMSLKISKKQVRLTQKPTGAWTPNSSWHCVIVIRRQQQHVKKSPQVMAQRKPILTTVI